MDISSAVSRPSLPPTSNPGRQAAAPAQVLPGAEPHDTGGGGGVFQLGAHHIHDKVQISGPPRSDDRPSGRLGTEVSQRVDNAADGFNRRLDNLLEVNDLTEAQISALEDARGNFESVIGRIQNALENGGLAPKTLAAGFNSAVQGLIADVKEARQVEPTVPDGSTSGSLRVDATRIDQPGGGDTTGVTPEQRIDGFLSKVDQRLENLADVEGLSAEQLAGLQEARDSFAAVLDRFENAFFGTGDAKHERIGQTFAQLLQGFSQDVHSALNSQTDPSVNLYDISGSLSPLGA